MSQTIKLGLLGDGISRTRAKNLHELIGELYGLDITYQVMDLAASPSPVSIIHELERCQSEGFRGVNVTHPYKKKAFKAITPMEHFPEGLTSVNTVLFETDSMFADNTDYSGFYNAYLSQFGREYESGKVLMFGAGGVGVAIGFALKHLSLNELVIYDLNIESARDLVTLLLNNNIPARVAGDDLVAEMKQADGLINATPVGMFQYPGNPFPVEGFKAQKWAFDAVYTPENTSFLQQCSKASILTLSGFRLFLYQGLNAFKLFTGVTPDAALVESQFLERYPLE